eukprot:s2475_g6.t1
MDLNPALAALEIQPLEPIDLFPATQVDEEFAGPTAEHPSSSAYPSEVPMTSGPAYSADPFATQVFDAHDVTLSGVDGMANFACVGEVTAGLAVMAHPDTQVYHDDMVYSNCARVSEVAAGVAAMAHVDTQVYHDDMVYSNCAHGGEVTAGAAAMTHPDTQVFHDDMVYSNFACGGEVTAGVAAMAHPDTQVFRDDMVYSNCARGGEVTAGVAAMAHPDTQAYHDDMVYSNFACGGAVTAGVAEMAHPDTQVYHDDPHNNFFCEGWMGPDMQAYHMDKMDADLWQSGGASDVYGMTAGPSPNTFLDGGALGPAEGCSMGTMGSGYTSTVAGRSAATDQYEPFCGNDDFLPPAPCSTPTALQHNVPATCAGPMVPLWQHLPHGDSQFIPDDDLLNCFQELTARPARPCGLAGGSPQVVEVESGDEAVHPAVPAMTTNDEHKAAEAKNPKAPTLPFAGLQKPKLMNFGTIMDSQEVQEYWHQPDRLRHPDSASFEATELDSSDCGDAGPGLGQEVGSSRAGEVRAAPEEASEAAVAACGLGGEALHDIDGAPLSDDDMVSTERGSSVEGEDAIEDQVSLLAFWEICRADYESIHGRPVSGVVHSFKKEEAGESADGEPFVPLRHADQSNLRTAKREENKKKAKTPKGAAAGAKCKAAKKTAAAKSSARKKKAKQSQAVAAEEPPAPAPAIAVEAAAPSEEPPTAGPSTAPEVSSVEAEPSERNAQARKRKRPQLIEKDQQESYRKNLARHLDENDGDTSGLLNLERSVLSRLQGNH